MSKATDIIDALGRPAIKERLNVGMTTISAAYVDGILPSAWFNVIEKMANEKGIDCPRDAFRFKPTAEPSDKVQVSA